MIFLNFDENTVSTVVANALKTTTSETSLLQKISSAIPSNAAFLTQQFGMPALLLMCSSSVRIVFNHEFTIESTRAPYMNNQTNLPCTLPHANSFVDQCRQTAVSIETDQFGNEIIRAEQQSKTIYIYKYGSCPELDLFMQLVVLKSVYDTIHNLDLVITPNGFGIVSNNTIAPASAERVKNFKDEIASRYNFNYAALANLIRPTVWTNIFSSTHGRTLSTPGSVFPEFKYEICAWWNRVKYIQDIEHEIARQAVSEALLDYLISQHANDPLENKIKRLTSFMLLQKPCDAYEEMAKMVDIIRKMPRYFDIWKKTEQYQLWQNNAFQNKKDSGGYWL